MHCLDRMEAARRLLMMTIMGFSGYEITGGSILYKGEDLTELDVSERARLGIAISQQRPPTVFGVKLHDILRFILKDDENPEKRIAELAKEAKLSDFLDRSINDGLSGGEIKREELLQLIAMQPDFSMMDEPDSGVDLEAMQVIGDLINTLFSPDDKHPAKRKSGLLITHSGGVLNLLNLDKAHVMHNGPN